jgi:hypothetical protein
MGDKYFRVLCRNGCIANASTAFENIIGV